MKADFKYILICILLSFNVVSVELNAEFFFDEKTTVLKEGDVVTGTLRAWPIENAKTEEFTKFLNTELFDSFFVTELISSAPSQNNADVFELKARFIILKKPNPEKMIFTYDGVVAHVKYHEVLFKNLENKSEEFFILNQSSDKSFISLFFGLFLLLSVIMIYRSKDKLINLIKPKPKFSLVDKYKKDFLIAKTRKDFEEIYKNKNEWMTLLEVKNQAHYDFLTVLNSHQYKEEWKNDELNEVVTCFDQIKGSFK